MSNPTLAQSMNQFRIASRELFNHFFRVDDPYNNNGWDAERRFADVQKVLFDKLVAEVHLETSEDYGLTNREIVVQLSQVDEAPAQINRELKSGYWDFPLSTIGRQARMLFVSYFDWDQLGYRDNKYVQVEIESWPMHPETGGKRALIESHYVTFASV